MVPWDMSSPSFSRWLWQIVTISLPQQLVSDLSTYCAASRTSLAWDSYGSHNPSFLLHLCSHLPLHLSVYAPQSSRQPMGSPTATTGSQVPPLLPAFSPYSLSPPWVSCLGLLERSLGEWQDCPTSGRLPSSMPKPRTLPDILIILFLQAYPSPPPRALLFLITQLKSAMTVPAFSIHCVYFIFSVAFITA